MQVAGDELLGQLQSRSDTESLTKGAIGQVTLFVGRSHRAVVQRLVLEDSRSIATRRREASRNRVCKEKTSGSTSHQTIWGKRRALLFASAEYRFLK